jgi:hypothetical protein
MQTPQAQVCFYGEINASILAFVIFGQSPVCSHLIGSNRPARLCVQIGFAAKYF